MWDTLVSKNWKTDKRFVKPLPGSAGLDTIDASYLVQRLAKDTKNYAINVTSFNVSDGMVHATVRLQAEFLDGAIRIGDSGGSAELFLKPKFSPLAKDILAARITSIQGNTNFQEVKRQLEGKYEDLPMLCELLGMRYAKRVNKYALKSAITEAVSKILSYWGYGGDIHAGKHAQLIEAGLNVDREEEKTVSLDEKLSVFQDVDSLRKWAKQNWKQLNAEERKKIEAKAEKLGYPNQRSEATKAEGREGNQNSQERRESKEGTPTAQNFIRSSERESEKKLLGSKEESEALQRIQRSLEEIKGRRNLGGEL